MKRIALTGGIGCGKSTILTQWSLGMKIPCNDADLIAHRLYGFDDTTGVRKAIVEKFGDVLTSNGNVDRRKLSEIIFPKSVHDVSERLVNSSALNTLNAIVHPAILHEIERWFMSTIIENKNPGRTVAVVAVPLLFEAGFEEHFDAVVCVSCKKSTQIERLMRNRNLTLELAQAMVSAHMDNETKMTKSDFVIWNEDAQKANSQAAAIINHLQHYS
jgi:dephospho-CoA kinase